MPDKEILKAMRDMFEQERKYTREMVREEAAIATHDMPTTMMAKISTDSTEAAVVRTFEHFGVDIKNIPKTQGMMANGYKCFENQRRTQKILAYAERQMESGQTFKSGFLSKAGATLFTLMIAVPASLGSAWVFVKYLIKAN